MCCYLYLRTRRNASMKRKTCHKYFARVRNTFIVIIVVLVLFIYKTKMSHEEAVVTKIPKSAQKFVFTEKQNHLQSLTLDRIKYMVTKYNSEGQILNLSVYGAVNKDTSILVIFVDKFTRSLKFLLASLSQLQGIENTLLIFSHSYFDEDVNNLIRSIDFSRVLQIFYPYSVQLCPLEFPGYNPLDCPHDMSMKSAEAANCTGAYSPDIHGRYRNPHNSEKKHHWWWTANKVFENLTNTANRDGMVVFLENDFFFMDDFFYMALYMKKIADSLAQCEFISLGTNSAVNFYERSAYGVEVTTWDPKKHSSVLAFDFSVWNSIVSHYDLYCLIDDHSWYRSLYYMSLNRRDGKRFKVISSKLPRAYKTVTGTYNRLHDFELIENIFQIMYLREINQEEWSPPYLEVYYDIELEQDEYMVFDYSENNGGWNDPRDKEMCSNMTTRKIKKVIMDMKNEFKDYIPEI